MFGLKPHAPYMKEWTYFMNTIMYHKMMPWNQSFLSKQRSKQLVVIIKQVLPVVCHTAGYHRWKHGVHNLNPEEKQVSITVISFHYITKNKRHQNRIALSPRSLLSSIFNSLGLFFPFIITIAETLVLL